MELFLYSFMGTLAALSMVGGVMYFVVKRDINKAKAQAVQEAQEASQLIAAMFQSRTGNDRVN